VGGFNKLLRRKPAYGGQAAEYYKEIEPYTPQATGNLTRPAEGGIDEETSYER